MSFDRRTWCSYSPDILWGGVHAGRLIHVSYVMTRDRASKWINKISRERLQNCNLLSYFLLLILFTTSTFLSFYLCKHTRHTLVFSRTLFLIIMINVQTSASCAFLSLLIWALLRPWMDFYWHMSSSFRLQCHRGFSCHFDALLGYYWSLGLGNGYISVYE